MPCLLDSHFSIPKKSKWLSEWLSKYIVFFDVAYQQYNQYVECDDINSNSYDS